MPPLLDSHQAAEYGLAGTPAFDAEMMQIGFGAGQIKNASNLPNLAPNYPYSYTGSCALAATAGSQGTIAIRTETGGLAFMVGQHFGFCLDGAGNALDLNRITVNIMTVNRNWMNQPVPVSMVVATTANPNGPRFMRDFVKPGDVVTLTFTNQTGTAGTMFYTMTGTRYNR